MNTAAIARHLNVVESAITRCEEWANVIFCVVKGLGARFVSKKIMKDQVTLIMDGKKIPIERGELSQALEAMTGRPVSTIEKIIEAPAPFLPRVIRWKANGKKFSDEVVKAHMAIVRNTPAGKKPVSFIGWGNGQGFEW